MEIYSMTAELFHPEGQAECRHGGAKSSVL